MNTIDSDTVADTSNAAPAVADFFDMPVDVIEAAHTVLHPATGARTVARIVIAGPTHPVRRAQVFARMRARLADVAQTGKLVAVDPEDDAIDRTAFAAACTLGWSGMSRQGQTLPFAIGAALKLYSEPRFTWLRDQVLAELDHREIFISDRAAA